MSEEKNYQGTSHITVIIDKTQTSFSLNTDGETILNAAIDAGIDAPYSCKGGICTTCKAKVLEGSVRMNTNYALTPREVEQNYVLVCQSHPTSENVKITWDI
jgi:ring-1,2-phenylacetyl-CoA epoxidase subunit PaaE